MKVGLVLSESNIWESVGFWAFMGIFVTQVAGIVLLLLNRRGHKETQRKVSEVEIAVNNVEVDIDHDTEDITLGQRLKRMEKDMTIYFEDNTEVHVLIVKGLVTQAISTFKQAYYFDDEIAAYYIAPDTHNLDQPWSVEWVNKAFERMVGLKLDQIKTGQYISGIHPDDRTTVMESAKDSMQREVVWAIQYRTRTRLSNSVYSPYFTVEQYAEPLHSPTGEFYGQLGLVRRIT